ncbi:LuxR family transcriptional regulator [Streptomyces sp. NPDC005180]|uniref:helix-turn-helix transcriptional regulator n=1 Tax=Streptomyces sp. NPDC005180 TaxID=3156868 RepID=UPI0033BAE714
MAATANADTNVGHGVLIEAVGRALATCGRALLTGPAGAGKTAVAHTVAAAAEARGESVLRLAPEAADQHIPEASAAALLATVPRRALDRLAGPQREAVALLRRETDAPHAGRDHIALRLALAEILRTLAAPGPVLLLIDNAQWLDAESTDLLRFALRLTPPRVRVLVAERGQGAAPAAEALCGPGTPAVRVPALGADEVAELLLRHGLPARLAGRIHQASGGNPRLALALGHSLAEAAGGQGGCAHHADPLPVSGQAREVARRLLAEAPARTRPTLLLAALATRPTTALLRRAGRPDAEADLARAERAGLVTVGEDGAVAFTAGALPTALAADAGWPERSAGHAALAAAVDDPVQAVRHRALAVDTPDAELAAEIARAADACRRRGQRALAAELGLLAAERTPAALPAEELARLVGAAEDAGWAGRADLARRATRAVLARDASPAQRVRARLAVIDAAGQALAALDETFAFACAEADAADDPSLLAAVQLRIAWKHNLSDGDPVRSRDAAAAAGALAKAGGDQVAEAMALTVRARMGRILADPDAEDILAEALALPAPEVPLGMRNAPQYLAVRHALFDDRLTDARRQLLALLPAVQRTGSAEDVFEVLRSLTEVELRRGHCDLASAHARRALELTIEAGLSPGPAWYVAATAEAAGGSFARAAAYARRGIRASEEEHDQVFLSRGLYALGTVQLATGEAAKAVATLRRVAGLEEAQQVVDPSILRWHGELAEALVAADDPAGALRFLDSVTPVARSLERVPVLAALDRARALALSAQGRPEPAVDLLQATAQRFEALGLPLERGRTLLALARVERRRRRRAPARAALGEAAAVFERAGAEPWLELARENAPESGAPRPGVGVLTDAEARLAQLVGGGASNQEAAAKLFLSVKTVEARLTRIYQKLDVRSRAQLATALRGH